MLTYCLPILCIRDAYCTPLNEINTCINIDIIKLCHLVYTESPCIPHCLVRLKCISHCLVRLNCVTVYIALFGTSQLCHCVYRIVWYVLTLSLCTSHIVWYIVTVSLCTSHCLEHHCMLHCVCCFFVGFSEVFFETANKTVFALYLRFYDQYRLMTDTDINSVTIFSMSYTSCWSVQALYFWKVLFLIS